MTTNTTSTAPTTNTSCKNCRRLERMIGMSNMSAADVFSSSSLSSPSMLGTFQNMYPQPMFVNPEESMKMVELASERLHHVALEDLYGCCCRCEGDVGDKNNKNKKKKNTRVAVPVSSPKPVLVVKHEQLELGKMLGHGQFNVVYHVENFYEQHHGVPKDEPSSSHDNTPSRSHHHHHRCHHSSNIHHDHHNHRKRPSESSNGVVVKMLQPKRKPYHVLATGAADLIKEALLLQALQGHDNIIALRGWSSNDGVSVYRDGRRHADAFFMVLEELSTTLKDKMTTSGDWKEEDLFLQDRLGSDYAYGYYHHHDSNNHQQHPHPVVEDSNNNENISTTSTKVKAIPPPHTKRHGFRPWFFGGSPFLSSRSNHQHHINHNGVVPYRSPQAQRALVNKQHEFFAKRLQTCIDLADTLSYMHDHRILHRDLKPANIGFVATGYRRQKQILKVFDFDMSRVIPILDDETDDDEDDPNFTLYHQLTKQVGSRRYICPEVARGEGYNLKSDVYTFGLLVFEMLSLHKPYAEYEANSDTVVDAAVNHNDGTFFCGNAHLDYAILVEGSIRPTLPKANWSTDLLDFVSACWDHDMTKRPTMKDALKHLKDLQEHIMTNGGMIPAVASVTNNTPGVHDDDNQNNGTTVSAGALPKKGNGIDVPMTPFSKPALSSLPTIITKRIGQQQQEKSIAEEMPKSTTSTAASSTTGTTTLTSNEGASINSTSHYYNCSHQSLKQTRTMTKSQ